MRKIPLKELEQFKTTIEYCTRFGYCRNFPAESHKRPVARPKTIEVKCQ